MNKYRKEGLIVACVPSNMNESRIRSENLVQSNAGNLLNAKWEFASESQLSRESSMR